MRKDTLEERVAVIGLGYVGLPVALAFARRFPDTIGFDIDASKVRELRDGHDRTGEIPQAELSSTTLRFTDDASELRDRTFFIVAVPTPVDADNRPDLTPIVKASETVGRVLTAGAVVVYESTVYPGVTEDICAPILERLSGLRFGEDFDLGYSPERINPGDTEHTFDRITKVVSASSDAALERVASAYGMVVAAGVHRAPSIKVAEAAKVIENTQRDLNIALMNEVAIIFDRLGIRTADVLSAARTKWNFLGFSPGLVGGHCIGVDPYYLTTKAEQLGYQPEVILAGRRINNRMGEYIATKLVKMLIQGGSLVRGARVGVLGLTFKENVADLRNSRVPDIVNELQQYGVDVVVHDPRCSPEQAKHEYGIDLVDASSLRDLDGLILAVPHEEYLSRGVNDLAAPLKDGGVFIDVRSAIEPAQLPGRFRAWSL
jgi:UDP-N-acetyl-D-galactosamine dehydrogenase